jgi:autotransporter strand-loop-strand O-heptosyltransferase
MIIKAHTSIIGDTGYNCHSRNFFKALHKITPVQVRNFTIGSSWEGYNNDEPHNKEYYIDDVLKQMLVEQTLNTENDRAEFPLYTKYKNEGNPDVHIVLNETDHYYFYDNYDGKKIAYNVWETTRQPDNFFERLKTFDQIWVPSEWQKECTIEQGIPADKVKVVPEGVDVKTYKPKNYVVSKPVNRPFRFLLVGRWDYRKATKEIIETFTKTFSEEENVELVLLVDNPFATDGLKTTEERLEKYGIKHSNLKIVHHLNKDEYVDMLKNSDVFLSCARGEGWNLPLIEAMSCGVPSIYSNWGAQLEFAKGRGIPVGIVGEISANSTDKDHYSWIKDAPGNFIEPDFEDLSKKMRKVVENYTIYKKKALDDSDEIRQTFTWENAAKIANNILNEFMIETKHDDDSVAIVLAHANTPIRKKLLKECLSSLKMDTILSTNYPVDSSIQDMVKWFVYSKDNPLLYPDEYKKYGVNYITWWRDENGKYFEKPFDYEHSYAVYDLTKRGIEFAKMIGKKKIHIINYDYIISQHTLKNHENLLNDYDFVVYEYDDKKHGESAYCSAFMSGKTDCMYDYFGKHSTKEEYYKSLPGFNILEMNLSEYLKKTNFKIKQLKMSSLLGDNKLNQADANNYNQLETMEFVGKSFKEISDSFDCDKTTYHQYHKHYPMFFEKWRDDSINIFEIGLDEGKSMNVWQNYFPFAKIFGMDISKSFKNPRCKVFVGDQNNIEDLRRITKQVPKCKVIVDDGSHVPQHQLKSFYYLFQNMLDWGGVYIIEDTECSYWAPDKDVYSFETGYLNLIDYFTKLNHQVNNHYNGTENNLHIKSITYGANCIIIEKKEKDEIQNKEYRFKDRLGEIPSYKENVENEDSENRININFIDQPFVEIIGKTDKNYKVNFIDTDTDKLVYSTHLKNNQWAKCNRHWFTNWKIEIEQDGGTPFVHVMDLKGKRVFIVFESSSLGDTIAWIPYVEEFRKKHNCHVIVSTFQNNLFKSEYPMLEFVEPGSSVNNLYALYKIGVFYNDEKIDTTRHRTDFRKLRLQEYATDILGLDFEEIRPRIKSIEPMKSDKPYICIANHSTAQSKYWNNPTGWQELVDYVKGLGYDVYLLSKEEDGYMGNKNPKGVIKVDGKTLEDIGSIMLGSKGFIGISSGLSWLAWSLNVPTVLISGQTDKLLEPSSNIKRIINEKVCHACFSRYLFDKGDWNWCPDHGGTKRQFECSKEIIFESVKPKLNEILGI